jgi:hypothetical protein
MRKHTLSSSAHGLRKVGRNSGQAAALVVVLASGCAGAALPAEVPAQHAPPTSAATTSPLGATRLARLVAGRNALAPMLAEWGLAESGSSCVLLFTDHEEWLVGCGRDVEGFVATGEEAQGEPVLHMGQSLAVSGQVLPFEQIKLAIVGTVGTWSRADGEPAPVLLLQDWDTLHSHHPGFTNSDVSEWLGVLVHEGFHAHQMWHPNVRRVFLELTEQQPTVVGPEDLANFYRANEEFRLALAREHTLLRSATETHHTQAEARQTLRAWLALYNARREHFRADLEGAVHSTRALDIDAFYTFVEGAARYVEARSLTTPPGALANDPAFAATRGRAISQLPGLGGIGPKYVYSIGMYLCLVLDDAAPGWQARVLANPGLLIGYINEVVGAAT